MELDKNENQRCQNWLELVESRKETIIISRKPKHRHRPLRKHFANIHNNTVQPRTNTSYVKTRWSLRKAERKQVSFHVNQRKGRVPE